MNQKLKKSRILAIMALLGVVSSAVYPSSKRIKQILGHTRLMARQPILVAKPVGATRDFLKHALLHDEVKKQWGPFIAKHPDMINTIITREEQHENTHAVVYHAQHWCFRVYQDFLRLLYEYEFKEKVRPDYTFLRWWHQASKYSDAQTFLDAHNGKIDDGEKDIFDVLLSVNFALFGNINNTGNCTFDYFLNNYSAWFHDAGLKELYKVLLKHYGFDESYADKFVQLSKDISTPEGSLFQILIPDDQVDTYAYLSISRGVPTHEITTTDKTVVAPQDYDPVKRRYVRSSGVLKARRAAPTALSSRHFNHSQGRVLLNEAFAHPNKNKIKIYRYTTIPADKRKKYVADLYALFDEMVQAKKKSKL